jgi:hypothetical protein
MGEYLRDNLPDPIAYFEGEGLKLDGRGKWRTTECRFHGGSDSMRVNTASGGHAQCGLSVLVRSRSWQQAREGWLRKHPLCEMCMAETPQRLTAATLIDHIIPHRGDKVLFWAADTNWQSLCRQHHDVKTAQEDGKTIKPRVTISIDGWPMHQ